MKTILISLISDQTIPNILAIHHFRPDELLFISTEEMERKNKISAILMTLELLGLKCQNDSVIVREDSILNCHKKLSKWIEGKEDSEFVVNLTGGTKIMSIAAYEFFKDYSSKMIYIPIPKNEFIVPFPKKQPAEPVKLDLRLSVIEYLTAYGLTVTNESHLSRYREEAIKRRELSAWIVENYDNLKNLLTILGGVLRDHRSKKQFALKCKFCGATREEKQLLSRLNFAYEEDTISKKIDKSGINYLTGGWLEEFCFVKVSELVGKGIDSAVIGLKIKNRLGRDNEFDIMFTRNNALYFIECKSLDQHNDKSTDALYKVGALQNEFGLRVESFLVTTSPYILKDEEIKQSIQARAEQFKTTVIPPSKVSQFGKILEQNLKTQTG
jgi:Domain of unknown function (DUF1887).